MMQLVIAENIPLSICYTAAAHPERLQPECSQRVFRFTTWMPITRKHAMSFWAQLTAADSNTEIKAHSQSKCFQLCN
jgi:hypothetical protein